MSNILDKLKKKLRDSEINDISNKCEQAIHQVSLNSITTYKDGPLYNFNYAAYAYNNGAFVFTNSSAGSNGGSGGSVYAALPNNIIEWAPGNSASKQVKKYVDMIFEEDSTPKEKSESTDENHLASFNTYTHTTYCTANNIVKMTYAPLSF